MRHRRNETLFQACARGHGAPGVRDGEEQPRRPSGRSRQDGIVIDPAVRPGTAVRDAWSRRRRSSRRRHERGSGNDLIGARVIDNIQPPPGQAPTRPTSSSHDRDVTAPRHDPAGQRRRPERPRLGHQPEMTRRPTGTGRPLRCATAVPVLEEAPPAMSRASCDGERPVTVTGRMGVLAAPPGAL